MRNSLMDRIISILTYYTMGIFGLIWLVFSHLTKKGTSSFLAYNIYQSIFISALLAVFSLVYNIGLNFISVIPFIGKLMMSFDIFINQTPIYFSFTLSGLILTIFITYLAAISLLGKKPFVPYISNIIVSNFGG